MSKRHSVRIPAKNPGIKKKWSLCRRVSSALSSSSRLSTAQAQRRLAAVLRTYEVRYEVLARRNTYTHEATYIFGSRRDPDTSARLARTVIRATGSFTSILSNALQQDRNSHRSGRQLKRKRTVTHESKQVRNRERKRASERADGRVNEWTLSFTQHQGKKERLAIVLRCSGDEMRRRDETARHSAAWRRPPLHCESTHSLTQSVKLFRLSSNADAPMRPPASRRVGGGHDNAT